MASVNYKALVLVVLMFFFALFVGGVFTYGVFFIAFFLTGALFLSGRNAYRNLVNIVWRSSERAETGETFSITMDFYNAGWLPIPFFKVRTNLSKRLTGEEEKAGIYSMMPGIKTSLKKDFTCRHKGVYKLGHVEVEFGDVFGLFSWKRVFDENIFLHVYPRVCPIRHIDVPVRQQFGTVAVKHNAYEDFASLKDIRKYRLGDSFKKIHWKVTAHRGEFYVRNVELNATADLNIFLDLYRENYTGDLAFDMEEKAAECAVSIIRYALSRDMSVHFIAKDERFISLSAKGVNRFHEFMDVISKTTVNGDVPAAELIKREVRKLDWDAAVLVITPKLDKASLETYLMLKSLGIEPVVVYIRKDEDEDNENLLSLESNGFKVYPVGVGEDLRRVFGGQHER